MTFFERTSIGRLLTRKVLCNTVARYEKSQASQEALVEDNMAEAHLEFVNLASTANLGSVDSQRDAAESDQSG